MDEELQKLNFRFKHVGINTGSMDEAASAADEFQAAFGFVPDKKSASFFAGANIEIMGGGAPGLHGHLAIGTSDIAAAQAYLQKKGWQLVKGSEKYKDGQLILVYLAREFAGFAVHLLQD